MTGQTLLDTMELLNQELQLQTSEADQARGLLALNVAQDYFESLASQEGAVLGDSVATITSTLATETTSFPTGFLRLDRIQFLDPTTNLPAGDLENIAAVGGHAGGSRWPFYVFQSASSGVPDSYYTNGRSIYWSPIPDGAYSFRVYGFKSADDITASGTFSYADEVRFPLASLAVAILRIGVDDDPTNVQNLSAAAFKDCIGSLTSTNRDGAAPLEYTRFHLA